MENHLRQALSAGTVKYVGYGGGGDISEGSVFEVDGKKVYVKKNEGAFAKAMFQGEFESLRAIEKTDCIRVPSPIRVLDNMRGSGALLVMEYLDLKREDPRALGQAVAKMHKHNWNLREEGHPDFVSKFGFHVPTYCGSIVQSNKWNDNWVEYYTNKLQEQMDLVERDHADAGARNLWSELKAKLPSFFKDIPDITPSLMHGDLWAGNVAQADGRPALFDPGSFYGHSEYDLGIAGLFGMSSGFFNAYHKEIPKAPGFEQRHKLYQLFHLLNHWNIFGGGYRHQSLTVMRSLL